ncbi:MAG: type II toxin-antitoxin system Phd/YefM family antitoxin [Erysipelotrichaceae bacterium]|jgi:prevent-host-death family protein|nr:type II toxin-antitoxin system Phd/YefM family antitoxin [Erysipelotrichaceae bacterium]
MCTITSTELKNNYGKYIKLAETEKIEVTKRGVVVFTMVPKRYELGEKLKSYFGILPKEASIGKDPDERD